MAVEANRLFAAMTASSVGATYWSSCAGAGSGGNDATTNSTMMEVAKRVNAHNIDPRPTWIRGLGTNAHPRFNDSTPT
jgi:hypothetical protein